MIVPAYFTEDGLPKTGLSPTVDIIDISDNSVDVNDGAMSEVGQGFYKYDFAGHDSSKNYLTLADSVTLIGDERYAIGTLEDNSRIADAVHDEIIEGTLTARQIQRLVLSFIAGETIGGGTTSVIFKNQAGDKSRITLTVDENGNRSLTVLDVS